MAFTDRWYKTIEEARDKLVESITEGISKNGKWTCSTCPTGAGYGWDPLAHEALVWLQANPPAGIKITSRYQHECYDWLAVTDLDTVQNEDTPDNGTSTDHRLIIAYEREGQLSFRQQVGFDPVVYIRKEIADELFRTLLTTRVNIVTESPEDALLESIERALNQYPFYEVE